MSNTYHSLLKGAIELHCHAYPSIFPRSQTAWELVEDVKAAGMAGVVLKAHEEQTFGVAELIRYKEPGLHVYGGLVCNYFTGGWSPSAVDVAIRSGAKVVWGFTLSGKQHINHFAEKKNTRLFKSNKPLIQPQKPMTIWDDRQQILPEVHDILQLIGEADIIFATGHLSPPEVMAVVDAAKKHGVRKLLIQHVDLDIAQVPMDMQEDLVRKGAILEKCYLACSEDSGSPLTVADMAESIRRLGPASCVMVTDYGQKHNIPPVQALSNFTGEMLENGLSEADITQMLVTNPRQLLGI